MIVPRLMATCLWPIYVTNNCCYYYRIKRESSHSPRLKSFLGATTATHTHTPSLRRIMGVTPIIYMTHITQHTWRVASRWFLWYRRGVLLIMMPNSECQRNSYLHSTPPILLAKANTELHKMSDAGGRQLLKNTRSVAWVGHNDPCWLIVEETHILSAR